VPPKKNRATENEYVHLTPPHDPWLRLQSLALMSRTLASYVRSAYHARKAML